MITPFVKLITAVRLNPRNGRVADVHWRSWHWQTGQWIGPQTQATIHEVLLALLAKESVAIAFKTPQGWERGAKVRRIVSDSGTESIMSDPSEKPGMELLDLPGF